MADLHERYSELYQALIGQSGWAAVAQDRISNWASDALLTAAHGLGDEPLEFADSAVDEDGLRVALVAGARVAVISAPADSEEKLQSEEVQASVAVFSIDRLATLRLEGFTRSRGSDRASIGYRSIEATTVSGEKLKLPLRGAIQDQTGAVLLVERLRERLV